MHRAVPHARCILHVHPKYATAIAALADPEIKPIDQNTAHFYNRVAYDLNFGGIADSNEEGDRLASLIGNRNIMMMGNHGVLVAAATVAQAFDELYYLERACRTLVIAYSTGQKLNVMPHDLAERTARDWEDYADAAFTHFEEMKRILDSKDPSYKD
jgi:ribulose-5-phosphate 4-epimerase/fuculose-1-phosphate aldolase